LLKAGTALPPAGAIHPARARHKAHLPAPRSIAGSPGIPGEAIDCAYIQYMQSVPLASAAWRRRKGRVPAASSGAGGPSRAATPRAVLRWPY